MNLKQTATKDDDPQFKKLAALARRLEKEHGAYNADKTLDCLSGVKVLMNSFHPNIQSIAKKFMLDFLEFGFSNQDRSSAVKSSTDSVDHE